VLRARDLARAVAAAGRVQTQLDGLAGETRLGGRLDRLRELLYEGLRWQRELAECAPLLACLDGLAAELPASFEIGEDDFQLLLRRAFDDVGSQPIGGHGGGVQVLNAMEARSRTFAALFLVGLNRDVFPRSVSQDPLLPDLVRRQLAVLLPDLPIKATGYDEDRYLFAQLLSSSADVTVSWQSVTDDGKDCARSTFVERLHWSADDFTPLAAPSLHALPRAGAAPLAQRPATANEAAIRAGLHAGRSQFDDALRVACAELDLGLPASLRRVAAEAATEGRLAVLREFDPSVDRNDVLGPYFGFAGARAGSTDPRCAPLYITTVESMARCPWQTFLARLLRLEAPPDPLEALPGSDPRLLGMVVHAVLEEIVRNGLGDGPETLEAARLRPPTPVAWPEVSRLTDMTQTSAADVLAGEGIALGGLARILAAQAAPIVDRARELDWANGVASAVVAAELEAGVTRPDAAGAPREIRFRADRVDAVGGDLVLTDYKTGRPISVGARASTREKHLLRNVAAGANLQAVAYALAAGPPGGTGRFLFLRQDLGRELAVVPVRANQEELAAAFDRALAAVTRAWDAGVFVPRLAIESFQRENPSCDSCELAVACLRGDSGSRGRLQRWIEAQDAGESAAVSDPERALLELWRLREQASSRSGPGGR
jgi:RecB family exonuclease